MNVERLALADLCQIAIDTADVHPFKLARADGGAVGARWLRDPRAGTDQDIAQYFASSAGAARVALSWLPDATELVLPVTTFHPLSDNADVALAATQHVALDNANVLVVPDRPVELPNASLHGMTLLCALCSQPERAFEMIAFRAAGTQSPRPASCRSRPAPAPFTGSPAPSRHTSHRQGRRGR